MKKLFYVLTLVLLLAVVPVNTVEAKTTKPAKPTIEVKYSKSNDQWYARFNCKTKGATIKYKYTTYGKYKSIKSGKWIKTGEYTCYRVYSVKGKTKSKVYKYETETYIEAKCSADMHKVMDKWVDKKADDFTRLAQICRYFTTANYFKYDIDKLSTRRIWYQSNGACEVLANNFKYICNQYGIKCTKVVDRNPYVNHAWNYVYLKGNNPIILDPTYMVMYGEINADIIRESDSYYTKYGKVTPSTRDELECGYSVLSLKASDCKFEKNKITIENDGYEGYTTIYTYSAKDGFWTQHMWDANGIEAKYDAETEVYDWCWYYGDDYPNGCAGLTEEEE